MQRKKSELRILLESTGEYKSKQQKELFHVRCYDVVNLNNPLAEWRW